MSDNLTTQPANILIVDDEPHVREIVRRALQQQGLSCEVARNGNEAWLYLQSHNLDLITLDVTMPDESGLELLQRIHVEFPDVAVIMLTAVGGADVAIQALTHGACGFLTKPVDQDELVFHVKRGLERRGLVLERRRYTCQLEERVRQQTETIRRAHEETIHRLVVASMYRDEETGAHVKRVGLFSEILAKAAGWPVAETDRIRMAAPMHDVGKIGIPDVILQKPGKLTDKEFEIMKTHTTIGAKMLAGSDSPMLQMAQEITLSHHERWDGTGYPQGIQGAAIPESGRIVAIVDVYDALSHDRVYRPAMPEERVLSILEHGRGTHFDAELLDKFFDLLPEARRISEQNPDEISDPCDSAAAPTTQKESNESAFSAAVIADSTSTPIPV